MKNRINCCLIGVVFLSFGSNIFGQSTISSRLLLVDLPNTTARVLTDLGSQTSSFKGQIVFRQTIDSKGIVSTTCDGFNLVGTSVRTKRGPSGPLGFLLHKTSSPTIVRSNGAMVAIDFEAVAHYTLIDQLKGFKRNSPDDFTSLVEVFKGRYDATLSQSSGTTFIDGKVHFALAEKIVAGVLELDLDFPQAPLQNAPLSGCDSGLRMLRVQPVFFRRGPRDPFPTGRSLDTFRARAESIWSKACVALEFSDPIVSDNGDFKVIESSQEMQDAVDFVPPIVDENGKLDGVAVLFVGRADFEGWDGGRTYAAGTERARIVVADDNLNFDPPSENVLAHELGHALSLCHPGAVAGFTCLQEPHRNLSSRGTVMCPSGLEADNPDLQSERNAQNVSNPLIFYSSLIGCCFRADCVHHLDCGPCP